MRSDRGSGTFASSSGMMSLTVSLGFAPSSMRTPPLISTGTSSFTFSPQLPISLGENDHFDRARHIFQRGLRVEIALLRFRDAQGR